MRFIPRKIVASLGAVALVGGMTLGSMAMASASTGTIGIGTGTGTNAPYLGASHAVYGNPLIPPAIAAKDNWSYPAIPIAAGSSFTENIFVQNTGTASEVVTISGEPASAVTMSSAQSGGAANYVPQAALADGSTVAYLVFTPGIANQSFDAQAVGDGWVSSTATGLVLAAGQEVTIPITVTVPAGTPDGTYYGVALATVTGAPGTGITSAVASGVRAYITVKS